MIAELAAKQAEVADVCRRLGVERLEVFGSAATGAFRPDESDIDLLVEFEAAAIADRYFDRYFDLKEALEELFGRPVDLVVSSAIRNPYFLESVNQSRTLLYAA